MTSTWACAFLAGSLSILLVDTSPSTLSPRVNRTTMKPVEKVLGLTPKTPPRPKLMVVFAQPEEKKTLAFNGTASRRSDFSPPEHMFLYEEEPSKELLPPFEGASSAFFRTAAAQHGEGYRHKVGYPQQDEQKPSSGYHYPKPQQDVPKPEAGYDYPKPQQDEQKPSSGYQYPKPQQDGPKPEAGYHYPKPQQDEQKPSSGYQYPKPQQDVPKPDVGYHYPKPQQDEQKPSSGYQYPKPQQDVPKPEVGYHYPKPQQDEQKPTSGYQYPKPQQDVPKPEVGYHYPKPQQDEQKPSSGYQYPKPQQDVPKPEVGYHYPKPQQDEQKPSSGYQYPKPQQDVPKPEAGYHYSKPQQDEQKPSFGYHYPEPQQSTQIPQRDEQTPSHGYQYPRPETGFHQVQVEQNDPVSSYGYLRPKSQHNGGLNHQYSRPQQDPFRPESGYQHPKPMLNDENKGVTSAYKHPKPQRDEPRPPPVQQHLNPQSPEGAQPPWRPTAQYGAPSLVEQDYLPPKDELPLDDQARPPYGKPAPAWAYGPPAGTSTEQDELPDSYLPPRPPPVRDEVTENSYLPPRQQDMYLPPSSTQAPLRDEYGPPRTTPISITYPPYLPPQPAQDDATPTPVQDVEPKPVYLPSQQDPTAAPTAPSSEYLPSKNTGWSNYPPLNDIAQTDKDADDALDFKSAKPRHLKSGSADEHGIRVTDMSCLRTNSRARFTATITSPTFVAWPPVLDGVIGPPPPGCRVIADPADPHHRFLVDLSHPNLTRCGVKGCSSDGEPRLCARVLLPTLPGLRLAGDPLLLLQCSLQPATGSSLQQARLAAAQPVSGRSAGSVHAGGERAHLQAQLQLFRRAPAGDFTRQMQPGSSAAVQLGDELQLRAVVRKGDGWQSSRLSDVVVRRPAAQDAVHIVSADGCVSPDMHAVCPRQQAWLAGEPLVSLLTMRVFMFRGMQDGEHLVISARVVACLDRGDCKLDPRHCSSGRVRRAAPAENSTAVFEETVSFQVHLPNATEFGSAAAAPSAGPLLALALIAVLVTLLAVASFSCLARRGDQVSGRQNSTWCTLNS